MKHGRGKLIWTSGNYYEGEFCEDEKDGKGKYTWASGAHDGDYYEGEWCEDDMHGYGKKVLASTGVIKEGRFEHDAFKG